MKGESGLTTDQSYIYSLTEGQRELRKGFKVLEESVAKFYSKRGNLPKGYIERIKLKEDSH